MTILYENTTYWTVLVVQWLRICLTTQGAQVQSLVWEDPTYHRATKPMRHKLLSSGAREPQLLKPEQSRLCAQQEKPPQ